MKHGAAKKKTHAQGARGNCTNCLQDPCGCATKDIPASYCGVVYDETKQKQKSENGGCMHADRARKKEKAHRTVADNDIPRL